MPRCCAIHDACISRYSVKLENTPCVPMTCKVILDNELQKSRRGNVKCYTCIRTMQKLSGESISIQRKYAVFVSNYVKQNTTAFRFKGSLIVNLEAKYQACSFQLKFLCVTVHLFSSFSNVEKKKRKVNCARSSTKKNRSIILYKKFS